MHRGVNLYKPIKNNEWYTLLCSVEINHSFSMIVNHKYKCNFVMLRIYSDMEIVTGTTGTTAEPKEQYLGTFLTSDEFN